MLAVRPSRAFTAATILFDRLTFAKKFALVGLVLAAPLAFLVYSYVGQKGTEIGFSAKERDGVVYVQPSATLLGALVSARSAAVGQAAGEPVATAALEAARKQVQAAVEQVDAADASKGAGLALQDEWSGLKDAIAATLGRSPAAPQQAFDAYNKLTEGARTLLVNAGNNSNLILDPDLDSFYLMDNTINKLPLLADTAGQVGDLETVMRHGPGPASLALRIRLAVYQGTLSSTLDQTKAGFQTAFSSTGDGGLQPALAPATDAVAAATKPVVAAAGAVVGGAPADRAATAAGLRAADAATALEQKTVPQLDHLLATRIAGFQGAKQRVLLIVLLATLLAAYLFVGCFLAIRRSLDVLRAALGRVGEGDLTADVAGVRSRDEIGATARAFQTTVESVRAMVAKVAETAGQVGSASQQMASTAEEAGRAVGEISSAIAEVAQGSDQQVDAVNQARAATEEMAGVAQTGADDAVETASAAQETRTISGEGVTAVESATAAMQSVRESAVAVTDAIRRLGEKSGQIGGIVETITTIAEQTNLLALNAAIEAARAGEQGRGFSVVAEEVRKLAEESQRAAASIATLIDEIQSETQRTIAVVEDGARQTEDGVAVVEQAREAFLRIGSSVDDMSGRVERIASAIQQIAASAQTVQGDIAQVVSVAEQSSAATEQVSATTQETNASTQEIAASAQSLSRTADELQELVGRFKLEL
jgi:methyl-accepting chemotaxis protein